MKPEKKVVVIRPGDPVKMIKALDKYASRGCFFLSFEQRHPLDNVVMEFACVSGDPKPRLEARMKRS